MRLDADDPAKLDSELNPKVEGHQWHFILD